MYHSSDPRAALAATSAITTKAAPKPVAFAGADYAKFYEQTPAEEDNGTRSWYARGQNFIIAYTDAKAGAVLSRPQQPDEYVLLLPDEGAGAEIQWNGTTTVVNGHSLSFIPAGASAVKLLGPARVVRMVTAKSQDLAQKCSNAASYAVPHPNIPEFVPWPEPAGGAKIRTYSLEVAPTPGRFGRIFRCSTFMVNFLDARVGPRDPTKMSPHHHDDFEQCSLALAGTFVHHLRWPWLPDMTQWRDDEHVTCGSPSIAVIPPPSIHTSQAVDEKFNQLVDIFCPPREDFSSKPGWVLNEADYPMPPRSDVK